jgi:hypothetical protein
LAKEKFFNSIIIFRKRKYEEIAKKRENFVPNIQNFQPILCRSYADSTAVPFS